MLKGGKISHAMHDAALDFQASFTIASFDRMPTIDLMREVRSQPGSQSSYMSDRQVGARQQVAHAIYALGGHGSPGGSCVWHVVGLQCSLREWAMRQGWNGKPVRQESAQGILVAALGVLAQHYGYRQDGERRQA